MVASATRSDDVCPDIFTAARQRRDVIARQLQRRKSLAAIHAQESISSEKREIVQRRCVVRAAQQADSGRPVCGNDRVDIDYPTVFTPAPGSPLPRYGQAIYGVDKYPQGAWSLTINTLANWKILGRKINLKNETVTYNLREI